VSRVARYYLGTLVVVAAVIAALVVARPAEPDHAPTVYAASSLRVVLRDIDAAVPYSFAGSGALQQQIEQGAPADVFASASPQEAQALFRAGRCDRPVTFATNRLVLLVPAGSPIHRLADLRRRDLRLAVGAATVPVGRYTEAALGRVGLHRLLDGPRVSREKDVAGVTAKVALQSADAGFVYHTDALATADRTREIALPAAARPHVAYQLCAVRRAGARTDAARAFIARVTGADGRRVLARRGFGLPPRG
jgi:molybdate transport system substrate-binding protein